ncbi:hypothetical protein [Novosphingobium sp.]|uniref:hypothetical protein n=1 Tax=Novosphingobium sp. TaxID=1874826 RepID=UPI0035B2A3E4
MAAIFRFLLPGMEWLSLGDRHLWKTVCNLLTGLTVDGFSKAGRPQSNEVTAPYRMIETSQELGVVTLDRRLVSDWHRPMPGLKWSSADPAAMVLFN